MIKSFFLKWIYQMLLNSKEFNEFINAKILHFYKNEELHHYRVWGDESRLKIGNHVHVNNAMINTISGYIQIDDYTFLGHNVSLLTGTHDITKKNIERQVGVPQKGRDIIIGKGVWISSNALIYGPCTIGDNAVIGAGSIVTGKIEANTLYASHLAKKMKDL